MSKARIARWIVLGIAPGFVLAALGLPLVFASSYRAREEDPPARTEMVTFRRTEWRAGDRVESKSKVERAIDYKAIVEGEEVGTFGQKDAEVIEKSIEILAAEEHEPTKIRVHYEDHAQTAESDDEDEEEEEAPASLLEGRTFVLELRDGKVDIRDEDGEALGAEVEELIRTEEVTEDDRLEVGVDRIADLIAEKPRRIGETIDVPEELARQIFAKQGPPKRVEIRLELVAVREIDGVSCGVFDTAIELEGTEEEIEFSSDLEGETWIAVETARFQGAKMSGRLRLEGNLPAESGGGELSGEGTIEVFESRSYSRE